MFQMLAEMVCAKEFLGPIALPKFVDIHEMFESMIPVRLWEVSKFLITEPARIRREIIGRLKTGWDRRVEWVLVACANDCAGPRMAPKVERILVTLSFVLGLEPVLAELAGVLFFHLMQATCCQSAFLCLKFGAYCRVSKVSNFFGFFGQHWHMTVLFMCFTFTLRVAAADLASDGDCRGFGVGKDPRQSGFKDTGVKYGESISRTKSKSEFGETPPAEYQSSDEIGVMLLRIESAADEANEQFRRLTNDVDETDPWG
jgi:hypothetical protein